MSLPIWVAILVLNAYQVTGLNFFSQNTSSSPYCLNIIPPTDWQNAYNLCKELKSEKSILQAINDSEVEEFYSILQLYNIYAFWTDVRKNLNSSAGDVVERLSSNVLPWAETENPGTDEDCGLVTAVPGYGGLQLLPSPCHKRHISLCLAIPPENYQRDGIFCANLTNDETKRKPELTLWSERGERKLVVLFPETLLGQYLCGTQNLPEKKIDHPTCWLLGFRPWHESSTVTLECLSVTVLEFNVTKIQLRVTTRGEGYLICQAWTNRSVKPILSNTLLKQNYHGRERYALVLQQNCSKNESICSNPQKAIEIMAGNLMATALNAERYVPAAVLTWPFSQTLRVIIHLIGHLPDDINYVIKNNTSFELIEWHSMQYCTEEPPLWNFTNAGRRALATDGTAYRICHANLTSGAQWGPIMNLENFRQRAETRKLHELFMGIGSHNSTNTLSILQSVMRKPSEHKLTASDTVIVGLILDSADTEKLNSSVVETVADITATMIKQDKEVLALAQETAESSNIILKNVDRILSETDISDAPDEKVLAVTPTFATLVFNLQTAGCTHQIRGLALLKKQGVHEIREEDIVILTWNDTSDAMTAKGIRAAAMLPLQLLSSLMGVASHYLSETELIAQLSSSCQSKNNLAAHHDRIVISIFWNDTLFVQQNMQERKLSTIIGVTVNGLTHLNLDYPLLLKYDLEIETGSFVNIHGGNWRDSCVFWDLNSGGSWSHDGCLSVDSVSTSCACFHTTHFGEMLHGMDHQAISKPVFTTALHYVALFGCLLSLTGLAAIIITALIFQSWRHQGRAIIQLQLCTALCGMATTLSVRITAEELLPDWRPQPGLACTLSGAALHIFLLASLMWMLAAGLHMRRRLLNPFSDFSPKPKTIQLWASALPCWLLPLSLAGASVWASHGVYESPECYPQGQILQFSVTVPAHMLIAANTLVLSLCIHATCNSSHKSLRLSSASQIEQRIRRQLLFAIYLSILLGLGWIFGLMHMNAIFNVTASLQGFSIFIFAVVLDEKTRSMWSQLLCHRVSKRQSEIKIRLTQTSSTLASTTASAGKG